MTKTVNNKKFNDEFSHEIIYELIESLDKRVDFKEKFFKFVTNINYARGASGEINFLEHVKEYRLLLESLKIKSCHSKYLDDDLIGMIEERIIYLRKQEKLEKLSLRIGDEY